MDISSLIGLVLDISLGALAFRLAIDLRKLVHVHDARIGAIETYVGFKPVPV